MQKSARRRQKYFPHIILLAVLMATTGAICSKPQDAPKKITLTVWRSEDAESSIKLIADAYKKQYSYVNFEFRTLKEEEYEEKLLEAWAKGDGPDIFSVPNWRLGKYTQFISPMPAKVKLKTMRTKKNFGKTETIVENKTVTLPAPSRLRDSFVETVAQDVVFDNKIYGLPYNVDTLVLYYNRDLLSKAQIAIPPTNWEEFRDEVQALVILDDENNIIQPAAALGTANNIPYFFDIISVLMMQNGTNMGNAGGGVFTGGGEKRATAMEALDFYSKFADPLFATYTWNDDQLNALEAFTQGNLGFYFGYYRDMKVIKQRAPNLNFSFTRLPQIDSNKPVDYARYSVESVSVSSKNADHAWNFIAFATSEDQAKQVTETTDRIPAHTALIAEAQSHPDKGVFAQQALTARSWYHGVEPDLAVDAVAEMLNEANAKTNPLNEIINIAASKIRLTL